MRRLSRYTAIRSYVRGSSRPQLIHKAPKRRILSGTLAQRPNTKLKPAKMRGHIRRVQVPFQSLWDYFFFVFFFVDFLAVGFLAAGFFAGNDVFLRVFFFPAALALASSWANL